MFIWFDIVRYGPTLRCGPTSDVDISSIRIFTILIRVISFFGPLTATLCCYIGIWYKMAFSMKKAGALLQ